jgi:hypothetical protein
MNAFAIVDKDNNVVSVVEGDEMESLCIYPKQTDADNQMVEWNDEKLDTSGYRIVNVSITVLDTPLEPVA